MGAFTPATRGFSDFSFHSTPNDSLAAHLRRGAEQNPSLDKIVATSNFGLGTDKPLYYSVFGPVNLL